MSEKKDVSISLPEHEARAWSDALADLIQWMNGFHADLPEDASKRLPTLWRKLSDIKAEVDQHAHIATIPF